MRPTNTIENERDDGEAQIRKLVDLLERMPHTVHRDLGVRDCEAICINPEVIDQAFLFGNDPARPYKTEEPMERLHLIRKAVCCNPYVVNIADQRPNMVMLDRTNFPQLTNADPMLDEERQSRAEANYQNWPRFFDVSDWPGAVVAFREELSENGTVEPAWVLSPEIERALNDVDHYTYVGLIMFSRQCDALRFFADLKPQAGDLNLYDATKS